MKPRVNIIAVVDVIGALSAGTLLDENLSMMDDGEYQSTGQGTPDLVTVCLSGQTVQWTVLALDLQTPVEIKSLTFLGADGTPAPTAVDDVRPTGEDLSLAVWSGVVPEGLAPGVDYRYRLELQMYDGAASVMHVDTCALKSL